MHAVTPDPHELIVLVFGSTSISVKIYQILIRKTLTFSISSSDLIVPFSLRSVLQLTFFEPEIWPPKKPVLPFP